MRALAPIVRLPAYGIWGVARAGEVNASPNARSAIAGAKPPTGAEQLRNTEQRGLIERSASSSDRRKVQYRLSSAGRALDATLMPIPRALEERALVGLTPGETGFLRLALMRIQNNLEVVGVGGDDGDGDD